MSVWIKKYRAVDKQNHPEMNIKADFSPLVHSGIYHGVITLQYLKPFKHNFKYNVGMLVIDLDELPQLEHGRLFNWRQWAIFQFNANDYLKSEITNNSIKLSTNSITTDNGIFELKQRVLKKVESLILSKFKDKANELTRACDRVVFVGQTRQLGCYFSPINLYFCYNQQKPQYMLAEINKSRLTKQDYFLIDLQHKKTSTQVYRTSPFVDIDMRYKWFISPPDNNMSVGVESYKIQQIFSGWMNLERTEFNTSSLQELLKLSFFAPIKLRASSYIQLIFMFFKKIFSKSSHKH